MRRSDFLKALIVVPLAAKAVVLAESMVSRCLFVGGDDGYKTIQGALNDAKSGDTVYVRPGEYWISEPLVPGDRTFLMSGSQIHNTRDFSGGCLLDLRTATDYQVRGNIFHDSAPVGLRGS